MVYAQELREPTPFHRNISWAENINQDKLIIRTNIARERKVIREIRLRYPPLDEFLCCCYLTLVTITTNQLPFATTLFQRKPDKNIEIHR